MSTTTQHGVFAWHPDPRYPASEAVRVYGRERDAELFASKLNSPGNHGYPETERGWVVRPVAFQPEPPA